MKSHNYKKAFKENDVINGFVFIRLDGVLRRDPAAIFKCKHCSKEFRAPIYNIVHGISKSCGCQQYSNVHKLTHGGTRKGAKFPEYRIWDTIRERCNNPNNESYPDYGGRGISICEEWAKDFGAFLLYVGRRPSKDHSIDRFPNNDGNYEPGNVRWATRIEQAANTRRTVRVTYKGKTKALADWCRELGLSYSVTRARINDFKWPVERALETPLLPVGHNYRSYKKPDNKFINHSFGYIT